MKRLSITFFACLFSFVALAGKIDKAFEALQSYNYFEAKELFYKILDKEPIAASFGLSVIYARTDNPFHQFDSAYLYLGRAEWAYARNQPDVKARENCRVGS